MSFIRTENISDFLWDIMRVLIDDTADSVAMETVTILIFHNIFRKCSALHVDAAEYKKQKRNNEVQHCTTSNHSSNWKKKQQSWN